MGKVESMVLQVADCSVVVNKSEPMKAGDSLEEKTQMKVCAIILPTRSQKELIEAKGTCFVKVVSEHEW
jgi:hypothetical protein